MQRGEVQFGIEDKRTSALRSAMCPALFFLILHWWVYAFTVRYVYLYGSQCYAYRQSFYAVAAVHISLLIHTACMVNFEFFYRRWKRHGILAKTVYLVIFYDLHACFTLPLVASLAESTLGHFRYFDMSEPESSWLMFNVFFAFVYTLAGLTAGVLAGALAVVRLFNSGKSGKKAPQDIPGQTKAPNAAELTVSAAEPENSDR